MKQKKELGEEKINIEKRGNKNEGVNLGEQPKNENQNES